jgi:hypothetical protein
MNRIIEESLLRCGVESSFILNHWVNETNEQNRNEDRNESEKTNVTLPLYISQFFSGDYGEIISQFLNETDVDADFLLKNKDSLLPLISAKIAAFNNEDQNELIHLLVVAISCLSVFIRVFLSLLFSTHYITFLLFSKKKKK